jgi:hypothetical protein
MRYRVLGKTDLTVSEVGFGAIPIIRLSQDEAVRGKISMNRVSPPVHKASPTVQIVISASFFSPFI